MPRSVNIKLALPSPLAAQAWTVAAQQRASILQRSSAMPAKKAGDAKYWVWRFSAGTIIVHKFWCYCLATIRPTLQIKLWSCTVTANKIFQETFVLLLTLNYPDFDIVLFRIYMYSCLTKLLIIKFILPFILQRRLITPDPTWSASNEFVILLWHNLI